MLHLIQDNCFKEESYGKLMKQFYRLGLDYEIVKVGPKPYDSIYRNIGFSGDLVEYKTDRKDVMVWGAIKLARLAKLCEWSPGSYMSNSHDYDSYSKVWKSRLFNYDSVIISFEDELPKYIDYDFFARPTKDSKAFTGKVFSAEEFETMRGVLKRNDWVKDNFNIQIAPIKKIQAEGRFWVVGGKIITGSYYRRGNRYFTEEIKDGHMWEYAQECVDTHQLAEAFVIDICTLDNEYYIMEAGCINCAGFYEGDMQKVIMEIEKLNEHGIN